MTSSKGDYDKSVLSSSVGLNEYVPANNGEYTIKTDRLLKDVTKTDLLIIPPAFGDILKEIEANATGVPYFKQLHRTRYYTWLKSLPTGRQP